MNPMYIVASIAAIPGIVSAILGWLNGRKADAIHILVNSNLDAVKGQLADAKSQIADLLALLGHVKDVASGQSVLASGTDGGNRGSAPDPPHPSPV